MVPDSPRQVPAERGGGSASLGNLNVFFEQQNSQQSTQGSRRGVADDNVFAGGDEGGMALHRLGGNNGVNQISLASSWLPLSFESLAAGQTAGQQTSVFSPTPWDPSSGMNRLGGNPITGSWEERGSNSGSMSGMLLPQQSMPNYRNSNDTSQQRPPDSLDDQSRKPPKDERATTRRPHKDSSRRISRASSDEDYHANKKKGDKSKKVEPGHGLGDIDPAILDALPQEDWKTLTSAGVRLAGRTVEELQAKALSIKNRRRESAARSRQHRAQHAVELEEENRQLKTENERLKMMLGVIQQGWPPVMPPF